MDHLLTPLLLLWSLGRTKPQGVRAEGKDNYQGFPCDSPDKADIVLIVEDFESISPVEVENIKFFISEIIEVFTIGPDRVQIGLLYNSIPKTVWKLNDHQTKQSLLDATYQLTGGKKYNSGGGALGYINNNIFKPDVGMRTDSQKIAVFITHGESADPLLRESKELKDRGIELYTIGVKAADESNLRSIVSDPEETHMYIVTDYAFLVDIVDNLTMNLCNSTKSSGSVRLVGTSRCAGRLEAKLGEWRPVYDPGWNLKTSSFVCRDLDCGFAVSFRMGTYSPGPVWLTNSHCVQTGSVLRACASSALSYSSTEITCSDSVRLVGGTGLCSGRLEVRSHQSNERWYSVCEEDFDQEDAKVVCRELSCGTPSDRQGGPYGEGEAPMWTTEFQCGGHESALMDCGRSSSNTNTCSPDKAVGLTCSEPEYIKLAEGTSRCQGRLEVKLGEWRPGYAFESDWTLKTSAAVCRDLDCGSAVSFKTKQYLQGPVWSICNHCLQTGSTLRECVVSATSTNSIEITCLESVRLVGGTSFCSGRLEVKSNERWSSVCEEDFDQQDAKVVCSELGCGVPSDRLGGLYGGGEAPLWTTEFQCGGHESTLMDCKRSGSATNTCSPDKAVGLTCSEPGVVRLMGRTSHCSGRLELKLRDWRPVYHSDWTLKTSAAICKDLDCGSAVSTEKTKESSERPVWKTRSDCVQSGFALRECTVSDSSPYSYEITCLDSVRLVGGTSLCSGRLEVKSNKRWTSVCEKDFDLEDAKVVCRELGCGTPSTFREALYGEGEAPMWTTEFQCEGHESALMDCRRSLPATDTCSPDKAVGLTCSEPDVIRLVGGTSRCAGRLEVKLGEWRPLNDNELNLTTSDAFCGDLDCGSAVSTVRIKESSYRPVWRTRSNCVQSGSTRWECSKSDSSSYSIEIICSGPRESIIRLVLLPLCLLVLSSIIFYIIKATRVQKPGPQEEHIPGVRVKRELSEEEGAESGV